PGEGVTLGRFGMAHERPHPRDGARGHPAAGPQPADELAVIDRDAAEGRFRQAVLATIGLDLADETPDILHAGKFRTGCRIRQQEIPRSWLGSKVGYIP